MLGNCWAVKQKGESRGGKKLLAPKQEKNGMSKKSNVGGAATLLTEGGEAAFPFPREIAPGEKTLG